MIALPRPGTVPLLPRQGVGVCIVYDFILFRVDYVETVELPLTDDVVSRICENWCHYCMIMLWLLNLMLVITSGGRLGGERRKLTRSRKAGAVVDVCASNLGLAGKVIKRVVLQKRERR